MRSRPGVAWSRTGTLAAGCMPAMASQPGEVAIARVATLTQPTAVALTALGAQSWSYGTFSTQRVLKVASARAAQAAACRTPRWVCYTAVPVTVPVTVTYRLPAHRPFLKKQLDVDQREQKPYGECVFGRPPVRTNSLQSVKVPGQSGS